MIIEWKNPENESPVIKDLSGSVCVMVTPGCLSAQKPMKAWFNGDGTYYLASTGDRARVAAWDYYPNHLICKQLNNKD